MLDARITGVGTPTPSKNSGPNPVRDVLTAFFEQFVVKVRDSITRNNKIASRGLWSSVGFVPLSVSTNRVKVQFMMESYWEQVDKGLRGRKSGKLAPLSPMIVGVNVRPVTTRQIELWAAYRGLPVSGDRRGFAQYVQRKVNDRGYKPSYFFTEEYNKIDFQTLENDLADAGADLIVNNAVKSSLNQNAPEKGI
jgi:hypothetical protein